ncbi:nitrate transporter, putative [Parvularcula bermudensis HTCC2503]|uniref:Nitrate transporter, putative n=1 Tax=Parvularcula bermudensis (strain ATCC BAA-594 / HTCC2503 / KCTC 12087) TaxID=314260 RepID=E0THG0_PARBH|nr:CmpA/NrtA family ABC transporter substrate-binding protein [Parvularcula bermudensis]ADM10752.1 nitrate transporter, putative [Parvularcula bermudensis HTCC2503]
MAKNTMTIGFIPLSDAAPLVLAKEEGLFDAFDIDVTLSKEHSWARVRDKLAIGDLDAAHMLSPMVIASALKLEPGCEPFATALGLNLNGNGITVSNSLYEEMLDVQPDTPNMQPVPAEALRTIAARRLHRGKSPITLAMVYPFSTHNYLLRYWLAASGLHPDRDVRLIVAPPPDMARLCEAESIDGFCVGEPWNSVAVHRGVGRRILAGAEVWAAAPEKVLGVRRSWLAENEEVYLRLVRAVLRALKRLGTEEGRQAAIRYLAREPYLGIGEDDIAPSFATGPAPVMASTFDPSVAGYPWHSKAHWLAMQMIRWGQITRPVDVASAVRESYRADLFGNVAREEGIPTPGSPHIIEGAHADDWVLGSGSSAISMPVDRFIDGSQFDSAAPLPYLEQFTRHSLRFPLTEMTDRAE